MLGRWFLGIALALQMRTGKDDFAELEENLRHVFARLPKIYEDLYPAVENCTEVGLPDVLLYGMSTALTVNSFGDGIRCSQTVCTIKCAFKWLRAKSRMGPGELFFENRELEILVHVRNGSRSFEMGSTAHLKEVIGVRYHHHFTSHEVSAAPDCVWAKRGNFGRTLEEAVRKIDRR